MRGFYWNFLSGTRFIFFFYLFFDALEMQSLENLFFASLAIVTYVNDLAHCELICHALNTAKDIHASIPVVGGIVNKLLSDQAGDIVLVGHDGMYLIFDFKKAPFRGQ
jgi:hypothetical protein